MAVACRKATEKWREEADRRKDVRTDTRPAVRDAQRALRAARKTDPQGKEAATHRAERELRKAKRSVPDPLWLFAAKGTIAAAVAAGVGLPHVPERVWLWASVAVTAAIVGALVWLVVADLMDQHRSATELEPTAEEKQLLGRLAPEHWSQHAKGRGLEGTITARPKLTAAGIVVAVRLDGKWTPGGLESAEDGVRALLGARTALRIEIRAGDRGGWAEMTLRTRLASSGADMAWTPEREGIGVDTTTGAPVVIPLNHRLVVAGASGSGKSWSTRPLMAAAHAAGDVVFVDGKGEEATVWDGVCRTAVEPDEIRAAVADVHAEMLRRKGEMKRRRLSVWDGRQLTLFVDEGRVILALKDKKLVQKLIDISALGRSRGVVLWWATQYPVTSGDAPGIHAQIAANTDSRFALRVKNLNHAAVALDDDADYGPHLIRADMRGHGYLGGYGPTLIRTWTMTDAQVRKLPQSVWQPVEEVAPATEEAAAAPADPRVQYGRLTLVKGGGEGGTAPAPVPAPRPATIPAAPAAPDSVDAKVWQAIQLLTPPVRQRDVVEASGVPKGSVSRAVKRLIESGHLVKHDDGTLTIKAGEVSA